jgi:hypothetical protein
VDYGFETGGAAGGPGSNDVAPARVPTCLYGGGGARRPESREQLTVSHGSSLASILVSSPQLLREALTTWPILCDLVTARLH